RRRRHRRNPLARELFLDRAVPIFASNKTGDVQLIAGNLRHQRLCKLLRADYLAAGILPLDLIDSCHPKAIAIIAEEHACDWQHTPAAPENARVIIILLL